MSTKKNNPETIAIHGGNYRSDPATNAVATALVAGSLLQLPPWIAMVSGLFFFVLIITPFLVLLT